MEVAAEWEWEWDDDAFAPDPTLVHSPSCRVVLPFVSTRGGEGGGAREGRREGATRFLIKGGMGL